MNPGDKGRIGVNTDQVFMAISDKGYYLTATKIEG